MRSKTADRRGWVRRRSLYLVSSSSGHTDLSRMGSATLRSAVMPEIGAAGEHTLWNPDLRASKISTGERDFKWAARFQRGSESGARIKGLGLSRGLVPEGLPAGPSAPGPV